ncbi:hypothetical protein B0E37_01686 [Streptomyces sp. MH192]|nr:hypothetical protein [Streptomyces sp. MH192]MCF0098783.1 hypothetical protein [Streptomyces sp. MH191]
MSAPVGDTPCPETRLPVPPAHQWLHATTGRIAPDPYSWMQAVHWIHGSGYYTPQRTAGPRAMNPTTLAIAQEISALKECRPGVDYLARKLKVSERTVQYHLGMLREAGLLVYRSKGTRVSGVGNQASVYERTIPTLFDTALGIRTIGEGVQRRPVGAAPEHRSLLGKLARKAARKVRRPRRRTPVSGGTRCTPMQVGNSTSSSTAISHLPSETQLASGKRKSPTPKKPNRGPRTLNKVGRRYQLAGELVSQVPWLARASRPRIAWIVRHVADAGWTALQVQAAAEWQPVSPDDARRPSGLLAFRLGNAHIQHPSPAHRDFLVESWQESRAAEKARHDEAAYDSLGDAHGPQSAAARRAVDEAFAAIRDRLAADTDLIDDSPLTLEDLSSEEITAMRRDAMQDPDLIVAALRLMGDRDTRSLYTSRLVDQALALKAINDRRNTYAPAF